MQRRVVEEAPGIERVVGGERVDEGLALDDDALAREPESAAEADGHEHADAAPCGTPGCRSHAGSRVRPRRMPRRAARTARPGSPPGAAARPPRRSPHPASIAATSVDRDPPAARPLGVPREPREPCGRARRPRAQRLEVVLRARDDAADERDEQQQVHRREPGRRVDVEHLEAVEDRREPRVVAEVLGDAVGVARALRHERARHRRDREQQQQEQRRAHARELPPQEAHPAGEAELRLVDRRCLVGGRARASRCGRRGATSSPGSDRGDKTGDHRLQFVHPDAPDARDHEHADHDEQRAARRC